MTKTQIHSWSFLFFTLILVFMGSLTPIGSDDTFMNLTLGRHLFTEGTLPKIDPYLFSIPDFHWHVWHQWLAYLYYYIVHSLTGFTGLIVARAIILTGFAYTFWRFGQFKKATPPMILSVTILAIFMVGFERIRADRASFFGDLFLIGLILSLLFNHPLVKTSRWIFFLPLLFLFWVNTHPSFVLGWGFLALYIIANFHNWAVETRWTWSLTFLMCVAITILNPLGVDGVLYPLRAILFADFLGFKEINSEWTSPFNSTLFQEGLRWRVFTFLAVGLIIALSSLRRKDWFAFFGTLILVYLCWSAVRFTSIAALGIGAFLVQELKTWPWNKLRFSSVVAGVFLVPLTWAFLFHQPALAAWWPRTLDQGAWFLPNVPISAVRHLANLPSGNVFNEYTTGGLLAWELHGTKKIAGHGHIDSPNLAMKHYWRFSHSPKDFRDIIGGGNVEYFLVLNSAMEQATEESGWVQELNNHWLKIYSDDVAVIFKRIHNYSSQASTDNLNR